MAPLDLVKPVDFFTIASDANYGSASAYHDAGFDSFLWQKNNSEAWAYALHNLGHTVANGRYKGFYITIRDIDVENLDDVNDPGESAVSANGRNNNITLGDETIGFQIATGAISGYPDSNDWILRDTNGDALVKADDSRKVLMDVGNADYRAWFVARLKSYFLATGDFTGETSNFGGNQPIDYIDYLWLDNGNADNCGRCRVMGTAYDVVDQVVTPAAYDGNYANWEAANIGFYQYIRANLCEDTGIVSAKEGVELGLHINLQGTDLEGWQQHAGTVKSDDATQFVFDGLFVEFFAVDSGEGHKDDADFLLDMYKAQYAEGNGQEIWLISHGQADDKVAETGSTRTWHNHYAYCLASYLLAWSNRARFRYTWAGYEVAFTETAEYAFLKAALGFPIGPLQASGSEGSQTFYREFERGTVSVTPSNNTEDSTTTNNDSFEILIDTVFTENTGGNQEVGDEDEGGKTWIQNANGANSSEFSGTVASYVSYSPGIGVGIPRWFMPDAIHGSGIQVSATDAGDPVELYDAQWDISVTANHDYILAVTANHSGSGVSGQRDYAFYLDGTKVIDNFDPVDEEGAQVAAFAWGQGTVGDTTATVTWEKLGSFSGQVYGLALIGPIADAPPIVNAINDQSDTGGQAVYLPVIASNPSGNGSLSYSIADGPSGLSFTGNVLQGTLGYHAEETSYENVTITVDNGTDSTDVVFDWVVAAGGVEPGDGLGSTLVQALTGARLLRGGIR